MTSLARILSLFSALIATSGALSCTECASKTSLTCSGPSVTCPSGYRCGSTYLVTTAAGGVRETGVIRRCTAPSYCDFNGILSAEYARIRVASSCCKTDDCTPLIPPLPKLSSIPNGLICESNISLSSTLDVPLGNIQCKGEENRCIRSTLKLTGIVAFSMTFQGCATKSLCDFNLFMNPNGLTLDVKTICTSIGIQQHQSSSVHDSHQEF
ncbi:phospholipase A2 inhibitor gamma subunit B-like [Dendropsophus ebraccatus]|uniref:phospholipase A2 inhibitor gamma subunit B-like n=1 Tax=Dendropsophus ebraccatus TaxID=150705 RepID=UPI003831D4AD